MLSEDSCGFFAIWLRFGNKPALGLEFVADTSYSDPESRVRGIWLELLPQVADVHVHGAIVADLRVIAPHGLDQGLSAQRTPRVQRQVAQQAELGRRQSDEVSSAADHQVFQIDLDVAKPHLVQYVSRSWQQQLPARAQRLQPFSLVQQSVWRLPYQFQSLLWR